VCWMLRAISTATPWFSSDARDHSRQATGASQDEVENRELPHLPLDEPSHRRLYEVYDFGGSLLAGEARRLVPRLGPESRRVMLHSRRLAACRDQLWRVRVTLCLAGVRDPRWRYMHR
jgi:hypothetical protein